ncbi:hypothetical protein HC174_07175 [Salinimicrobium sp. CDJ15-81-2]|nr:hypothetical protein [Salinimicrobium nanhaiense]
MKDLVANFYELWGGAYLGSFSDQMYDNDLYFSVAIYSILVALVLTIAYYYVIDRPGTAKISIWALNLLVGGILSTIIAYVSANNDLTEIFAAIGEPVPTSFSSDMLVFALINAMWTVLLMVLLSFILKWKSPNSSYVPF